MRIQQTAVSVKRSFSTTLIWGVFVFLFGIFVLSVSSASARDQTPDGDQRLITVYDQGEEKTFLTNKTTVGDALRHEDIHEMADRHAVCRGVAG